MLGVDGHGSEMVDAWSVRTEEIGEKLASSPETELVAPSRLPGWDRLTIVCHLRYGMQALRRMTNDALEGKPTSYYPCGRELERPRTLRPLEGETAHDVVEGLREARAALGEAWERVGECAWVTPVTEPADNPDLGPTTLGVLAMAALTEAEVHGCDLGLGLSDWSETFVRLVLPARLEWLNTRRTNHREFDRSVSRTWLLVPNVGRPYLVSATAEAVTSRAASVASDADVVIEGDARDLLAMLLGRPLASGLNTSVEGAAAEFQRAFPGP